MSKIQSERHALPSARWEATYDLGKGSCAEGLGVEAATEGEEGMRRGQRTCRPSEKADCEGVTGWFFEGKAGLRVLSCDTANGNAGSRLCLCHLISCYLIFDV